MENYINDAIKAAQYNGLTLEQILENPMEVLKAYHESQMAMFDHLQSMTPEELKKALKL